MRSSPVPSPCVSVCRIDPASGLCVGCLRTLDEIAAWGSLTDGAKRAIWNDIERRRGSKRDATTPDATGPSPSRRGGAA
ncbi:MAG: DUF1289 domain-containing protein [Burkholderiaceae bacterium]|nr:DUF1289 domain-containing protein [Burkholderiaceae bacterium]HMN64326.1 DUF1289 domain-containing protein [Burkholderiaceae bacterium]